MWRWEYITSPSPNPEQRKFKMRNQAEYGSVEVMFVYYIFLTFLFTYLQVKVIHREKQR